ncbi:HupE/UreJ family protein [Methylomarinum sp. Ch1-1]|uniref:HupE/UreJ family protein n=1 Tax=Methylomarinum roseum TaxID=3067653 RepID=A0AAU7NYP3_9GAMM|nr:HupE/UreJ family protein [Methylomarinum sp. Ch1-1]MDP4521807.1 HupE/UreJ family protein [Methylomarinum sp. Ch1-1]
MNKQKISRYFYFLFLFALSFSAHAHSGAGSMHGFADGFIHPWLGIDHLLAMSAVGLWAALMGGRSLWQLPVAFLTAMAAGVGLSFAGIEHQGAEAWVAFSLLALGLILFINRRLSTPFASALVGLFALGHGYLHAAEIGVESNAFSYALGFLLATALLHGVGIAAGLSGPAVRRVARAGFALSCTLTGAMLLAGI